MEDSERRKAIELLKEMRGENNTEDGKPSNQDTRLNWMYKGPSDLVDREEYLLGKAIDKSFEALNSTGNTDAVGRTGEQSNVPKKILAKTDSTEQVDIAKKILEDPLYAIKQKEMEARKKLLNNPVKLKQIKQMLMERSKQNSAHKKKKKSKKKSEQELNLLILKKLKKFTDKEKRKALNKIMRSDSESSSSSSSSSHNDKVKKHKSKRKDSSSSEETDSSSETESSSEENRKTHKHKDKKRKSEGNKKKSGRKRSGSDTDSSDDSERNKKVKRKKLKNKKSSKKSSSSSESDSSSKSDRGRKTQGKKDERRDSRQRDERRDSRQRNKRNRSVDEDEERRKASKRDNLSDEGKKSKKNYGLMVPDGAKPEVRHRDFPPPKYEKNVTAKTKYVPPPKSKPLSEKEREEKLREMMEDAKVRKQDREKNLASHRKKQAEEEGAKSYDDDFMRRQMSELTSQGTMADRIKSNINNIQRSKSSMDSSFMRK